MYDITGAEEPLTNLSQKGGTVIINGQDLPQRDPQSGGFRAVNELTILISPGSDLTGIVDFKIPRSPVQPYEEPTQKATYEIIIDETTIAKGELIAPK